VFGVLKEQRGMRRFARRGLAQVAVELALAATAYNLTRMWRTRESRGRRQTRNALNEHVLSPEFATNNRPAAESSHRL
jgi:hypothetical protein